MLPVLTDHFKVWEHCRNNASCPKFRADHT